MRSHKPGVKSVVGQRVSGLRSPVKALSTTGLIQVKSRQGYVLSVRPDQLEWRVYNCRIIFLYSLS